jgi:hypothetical protein
MRREELIRRLAKRAGERYGVGFRGSLFDDLVDDGLIPEGRRVGNDNKRPLYDFHRDSYRRALQIIRLRKQGIVGRDAIRVQLFIRGYSLPVWDDLLPYLPSFIRRVCSSFAPPWGVLRTRLV